MKHFVCVAMVLLVFVGYIQAAEVPFVELKGDTGVVNFAAFSPDGAKVITSSADKTARNMGCRVRQGVEKVGGTYGLDNIRNFFSRWQDSDYRRWGRCPNLEYRDRQ